MLHKIHLSLIGIYVLVCLDLTAAAAYGNGIGLGYRSCVGLTQVLYYYCNLAGFDVRLHFHASPSFWE